MSLDGHIAGPKGESDWIVMDPDIDFGADLWLFGGGELFRSFLAPAERGAPTCISP